MIGSCRTAVIAGLLAVAVLLAVVGGCGVAAQGTPDTVAAPAATPSATPRTPVPGSSPVVVYLLRDQRLVAVDRRGDRRVQTALDLLAAGPSAAEAATGVDTAIAPQAFTVEPDGAGLVVVAVGAEFGELEGRRQLLAAGQVVWTVTGTPGVQRVRLLLDGRPLPTPTDRGLIRASVGRSDFRSISPQP